MQQEFRVGDIRPNPYRHIERYPIIPEKVTALEESFDRTGFWDNIVVRMRGGKPEAAYGHHRLAALKKKYGPDHKAFFIVREFGEADMLKAMADENGEVYGANAAVDIETLRSLLEGWAKGTFPKPNHSVGRTHEYSTRGRSIRYTAEDVAEFFGWAIHRRTEAAVAGLEAITQHGMKTADFEGVSIRKAETMARTVARAPAAARSAVRQAVVAEAKRDHTGSNDVFNAGHRAIRQHTSPGPQPVIPREVIRGVANQFATLGDAVRDLNDLLIAHPEAAAFVRDATGRLGTVMPHYLANMMVRFDPEYQMLVEVVVNGQPPVARPVAITSPTAPANAKVVS